MYNTKINFDTIGVNLYGRKLNRTMAISALWDKMGFSGLLRPVTATVCLVILYSRRKLWETRQEWCTLSSDHYLDHFVKRQTWS